MEDGSLLQEVSVFILYEHWCSVLLRFRGDRSDREDGDRYARGYH